MNNIFTSVSTLLGPFLYSAQDYSSWIMERGCVHRVHIVAMSTFWRTFHHDGKISPAWWGWGGARPPSLTPSTITSKVVVYIQLRGQIHSLYFFSTPICALCLCLTCVTRIFLCVLARPLNFLKFLEWKHTCFQTPVTLQHLLIFTSPALGDEFLFCEEEKNDVQYWVGGSVLQIRPYVFGPSGSGSYYHEEKNGEKNLYSYCFVTFL